MIELIARIDRYLAHYYYGSEPWPNGRANPDNDLYFILMDCKKMLQSRVSP